MLINLINALITFQGLINHMLYDHLNDFMMAYLDDILIFSKTKEEHEEYIKEIL